MSTPGDPNLPKYPANTPANNSVGANANAPVDSKDPARYTRQQEREMGVTDDQGRSIQPSTSFVMIALTFVGIAAVGAVIVAVYLRFSGAPVPGQ